VQDEETSRAGLLFLVVLMFGFLGWWWWPAISPRLPEIERVQALVGRLLSNEAGVRRAAVPAVAAATAEPTVQATAPAPTPLAVLAPHCQPGEPAKFTLGFADLKEQLGDRMGVPLECEYISPENGDSLQATSTGLAVFQRRAGLLMFTDGWSTWALLPEGVVSWTADQAPPPAVARLLAPEAAPGEAPAAAPGEPAGNPGEQVRVANTDGAGVALRSAPDDSTRSGRGLAEGSEVTVLEREAEWARVRSANGLEGWIPTQYLRR
jgi:hypothetical protein